MKRFALLLRTSLLFCILSFACPAPAEVMLQWFETDWDEMYQKLPKVAEIGYDSLWIPPPTKAPTGTSTKWGNVGYSLYDRFDLGDVPQRGTRETRYGSRGSLRNMVDNAHRLGIKIIPDIVMNHNGNGPDFREYPGMTATDFHVQWQEGYVNTLNYKRAPRMNWWYHHEGYGATMWTDLANLADIRTEDHPLNPDPKRFTGPKTDSDGQSFNFVDGTCYLRHVGQYDRYPYAYTNETAAEMLYRWIVWLGNAIDYDGLRLDAGKHTPTSFSAGGAPASSTRPSGTMPSAAATPSAATRLIFSPTTATAPTPSSSPRFSHPGPRSNTGTAKAPAIQCVSSTPR